MNKAINKPVHQHDCDQCVYLGTYIDGRDTPTEIFIDCYWCNKDKSHVNLSSVLGRCADRDSDYISCHPPEAFDQPEHFTRIASGWYLFALLQAVRMGLYNPSKIEAKTYAEVK